MSANENLLKKNNVLYNHYITIIDAKENRAFPKGDSRLAGEAIAVKDLVFTKGVRTTAGSKVFENFVPDYSASIVECIEENGGVIVGKTNMHEFAAGSTCTSKAFGTVKNPHNTLLIAGGSSGGSAASVAAGEVDLAIGTDTGGSVRIPAAFCGVVGFKPTFGRISRFGIFPLAWSMDTVGILGSSVSSVARLYNLLRFHDPQDPQTTVNISKGDNLSKKVRRIGIVKEQIGEKEVQSEFNEFVNKISTSYDIDEVSIPELATLAQVRFMQIRVEMAAYFEPIFEENKAKFGADILSSIQQGLSIKGTDYVNAQRLREVLSTEVLRRFKKYDALISPTVPVPPPKIKDVEGKEQNWRTILNANTSPYNMVCVPAISLPYTKYVGIQIATNLWEDRVLLSFSEELESLLKHRPKSAKESSS